MRLLQLVHMAWTRPAGWNSHPAAKMLRACARLFPPQSCNVEGACHRDTETQRRLKKRTESLENAGAPFPCDSAPLWQMAAADLLVKVNEDCRQTTRRTRPLGPLRRTLRSGNAHGAA